MPNSFEKEAAKYLPKIRDALIRAFNEVKNKTTQKAITEALASGGPDAVIALLGDIDAIINKYVSPHIDEAVRDGGALPLLLLPASVIINYNYLFDLLDQDTAKEISDYKESLIKYISTNSRGAIRQGIDADLSSGLSNSAVASNVRNNIGLTKKQELSVRNYRKYLENLNKAALRRSVRDRRFDSTISRAIENNSPLSLQQISKMTNRYREKFIKFRAKSIGSFESLRAVTVGNHESLVQMSKKRDIKEDEIRRFWVFVKDGKARASHVKTPSLNRKGVPVNGVYETPLGPLRYPRDPRGVGSNVTQCRCSEEYKTA